MEGQMQKRKNVQIQENFAVIQQTAESPPFANYPHTMIFPTMNHHHLPMSEPVNNFDEIATDQDAENKFNDNLPLFKLSRRSHQFVDPDCYRMGMFLSTYMIDGRAVNLQPGALLNQNNHCYVNSILQALIACPPLYNLLNNLSKYIFSNERMTSTPVIFRMCRFVEHFVHLPSYFLTKDGRVDENSKNDQKVSINTGIPFGPTWIYKMLHNMRTDWIDGRQQDAEECLGFLWNGFNDEMFELNELVKYYIEDEKPLVDSALSNDSNNVWNKMESKNRGHPTRRIDFTNTPISDIFGGQLKSSIHRNVDHITENTQPFLTLPLNIEKVKTVRGALKVLVSKNILEKVTSSKTNKKVEAWEQITLCKLPVILILLLKFFKYSNDRCTKIIKAFDFEFDLKVDSTLISLKTQSPTEKQYKLFAVVYHEGKNANIGHYVTDAFHVGYNCWIRYDESSVVQKEDVLKPQLTRVPYLLFYRKSDMILSK
nr:ubiquitin carboxyl-terminal hydrolase 10-like [Leptinotarsa decemlineata]